MIKILGRLPKDHVWIAFSGGVDSVVAAHFLSKTRKVSLAYFNHGTEHGQKAQEFVIKYAADRGWGLAAGNLRADKPKDMSKEEFWREERYKFFEKIGHPIITGHHLNDCMETYIFSSLHGTAKTIPYRRNQVIRPFLLTPKQDIINWAVRNKLEWIDDPSNDDTAYMRNLIRKELLPTALKVNPGLAKVVAKKVKEAYEQETR